MSSGSGHSLSSSRPAGLSLGLVAAVFIADLFTPLGVASGILYTFAVLLALRAKPGWFAPAVAAVCMVLTLAKMGIAPDRGTTELWKVIVNRGLSLFAIGMTTILGVLRRRADADRVRAEAAMREQEAELARMGQFSTLGQVSAALAHELNQPLAAVCLQADLAAMVAAETPVRPELNETLQEIVEQSHRAAEIVRAMRRMARSVGPGSDPVDLNDAVRTIARLLDWQARRSGVEVIQLLADDPFPITHGDRTQIEQVIFNLLQNAIEAVVRHDGPRIVQVETVTGHSDTLAIRVTDTGPGIVDGPRLFEQFYTTKPDGMGMGLAISRSIVESHGGRIRAAAAPGGGAIFTVLLPIRTQETVAG